MSADDVIRSVELGEPVSRERTKGPAALGNVLALLNHAKSHEKEER